jgi:peroxiredoxin
MLDALLTSTPCIHSDMAEQNHPGDPMLQAEVGGGARIDTDRRLQRPGYLIRDFLTNSVEGRRIQLSDYRGHSSLVLVFAGSRERTHDFLTGLASYVQQFAEQQAVIIVVLPSGTREPELLEAQNQPLVLLIDEEGSLHQQYGAVDNANPAPLIYVTDRFGEIVSVYTTFDGKQLPSSQELLKLLEFINNQCPECEPPEWPR